MISPDGRRFASARIAPEMTKERIMAAVSFASDIVPLFDPETDIPHMAKAHVMLADYDYMSNPDNARNVLDHLTGAGRPRGPLSSPA